ncbi:MAG: tetratricopeptide repeat protein, partial [Asgard group archaeon]|nr:tetratricopeptide repeat protein [Asgard group archaeon]
MVDDNSFVITDLDLLFSLATERYEAKNYLGAIEAWKEALKIDQSDSRIYYNISYAYHLIGAVPEAIQYCKKAIAINNSFDIAYDHLGMIY